MKITHRGLDESLSFRGERGGEPRSERERGGNEGDVDENTAELAGDRLCLERSRTPAAGWRRRG